MKNLTKLPPPTDAHGNILSNEELAQIKKDCKLSTFTPITKEEYETQLVRRALGHIGIFEQAKQQAKQYAEQFRQMTRSGQMSLQEWRAPVCGFDGFTSILCELNPDFDVKEAATLGDFQKAATAAVINTINARTHPQHEELRQIYSDFQAQEKEQRDVDELWYQWDIALQATAKYRPPALDKVEFHKSRDNYTLREFIEWLEITKKKKKKKGSVEVTHPLRDDDVTKVPNDPASALFSRIITQPKAWRTNENDCHKYAQDRKNQAVIIYRPDEEIPEYWNDFRERVLQSLESRFAAMKGELVADVADILFWHWLSNGRPAFANITLAQILEYRKVKARPNVIEEHWLAMRDVRAIRLRGAGIESEALFHISAAQPNLWGTAEPPKLATVYRYHPGYFLSEAIQRDAFFLAYYARSVWQLDYYRDANAKKLARVLRPDWRRNAEPYLPSSHALSKAPRYRTWNSLLTEAGIDTESGVALSHPMRFIKSIENELEKLYKIEFVRECAPAIYHPDDRAKRDNLPTKGALAAWLALRTYIAPAADITDALAQTATRRLALKAELKALAEKKENAKKTRNPRKKDAEK